MKKIKKMFNVKNIPIIITIFIVLLSVGYSSFEQSMNITGAVLDVRVDADIRVTGISVDSVTNNAVSSYEEYNVKNISMGMVLPKSDSTVTYKVAVTNFGNVAMGLASITNLPSNLDYEITGYNLKDKICDSNNKCTLGITKEFYITIKYKSNQFNASSINYMLNLNLEFKQFYNVTYKNIINIDYPTGVLEGEDLNVRFNNETSLKEIKMGDKVLNSSQYTFDGYNLTVPNVDGDVTITGVPTLITSLLEQYQEGNQTGLVKDSTNPNLYYYKGTNEQVSNNFLWYGGHQWRVLEFDTNENSVTLITQQPLTTIQPASTVWKSKEAYKSSYINLWLNDYFWNSLDSSIQSNIQTSTFNIGIYTDVDEITTTQNVGLLDEDQYKRAGEADSFLDIKDYFWLGNRYSSPNVRAVRGDGNIGDNFLTLPGGVRAVIKISDITITGGDGTLASNYQVANKATNTSNVQVGEYINVPYSGSDNACGSDNMCTFRVVSKDSDSIKVVLNGLLPGTSTWADNASDNITTSDLIYTNVLNPFIANIDSKYITTGTYGVGMYESANSYTVPQSTTITANIGLPTVGEMFSGNDIDLSTSSTKTFVDVNTIENSIASSYYWTMNRSSSSSVRNVFSGGYLSNGSPSNAYGVRAVIYLKSGTSAITFTGGEGTAQSPYELPKTLIGTLLEQYSDENTTGLVKDSANPNLYYYTGTNAQVSKNFLWYGGHQWRVLEFDTSAKTLTLITQQPLTSIQPASTVWTSESTYKSSYINKWLNEYFWNSLDSSIQSNIQKTTFNIGIYTDIDEITTVQKVGLLDEDQYKRAGDGTTGKDSYLDIKDYFWLGNRDSSSRVRIVYYNGTLRSDGPSGAYGVRAVIEISDITITGGDGTLASNYQVENKATNTNNVQVGEYINVPYSGSDNACGGDNMCTFRVVSKDANSVKVVLNGLLPTTSKYGSSSTISTSHTIYAPLSTFAAGISDTYRYTKNKTFYIGDYPFVSGTGQDYKIVQDETLGASIGLPTVGEMFSGNDIDLSTSSTKTFVDVNTIENPTVSYYYWTMNRLSSFSVRTVRDAGDLSGYSPASTYGVRAVIYLKSGLELTGEGTAQNPYEIIPPTLISSLLGQYQEGNTTGLVKDSTNPNLYYYKGTNEQVSNNFLWYGGHQWRVLEFDTSAKTLTLITQQPLTSIQPASTVWTSESTYKSSYINKWLNEYFWNSLDSSIQSNIQKTTFNIGIYTDIDEITTVQKVGLLDEDQYKRAGNTNSFLDIKDSFWLGNRYSSSDFRCVHYTGDLSGSSPTNADGVRAVIKISDITITGGDGTLASNYQVGTKATNTNNVQIGEYINVPYSGGDSACGSDNMCTFRVLSKDNDNIKVVLNGLLPTTSQYGSSATISTSHTIYTKLNAFAEGISNTYRYTGNKIFYIGDYPFVLGTGQDYKVVQDETLEASVGLPTVGEMFSGNDIDLSMSNTKTFVDVNIIENPTAASSYWTMNRFTSSNVRLVYYYGSLFSSSPTYAFGVRAVIYLKSGTSAITFTGGEGTPNSPYVLQ